MRRVVKLVVLLLSVSTSVLAQDYAVSKIPAKLMENAGAVKRIEQASFEITEGNKAVYKLKVAYTILNEQGDRWGAFSEGYDKLRSIESFEGRLYNAAGEKIRSTKKSEIRDESSASDGLAADN